MNKHFWGIIALFLVIHLNLSGQSIVGGAGRCACSGNPNSIATLTYQWPVAECLEVTDTLTWTQYRYVGTNSVGSRWVAVGSSSTTLDDAYHNFDPAPATIVLDDTDLTFSLQSGANTPDIDVKKGATTHFTILGENGKVGVGTSLPLSDFDVSGYIGLKELVNSSDASVTSYSDVIIFLAKDSAQVFNLPACNSGIDRRVFFITNPTGVTKTTANTFLNLSGVAVSSIAPHTAIYLQCDGSSWRQFSGQESSVSSGIDTLFDYTALRAYTGNANGIYITRDKNKGLFIRSASGTDNGGTLIQSSNGVKWSRLVHNSTYRPEWWNEIPTDTVFTNEINQANSLAAQTKGTVLFEGNYAVDSLHNYFGAGYCIEAKSNVTYDIKGSVYLKSGAVSPGRKIAVFVGTPGAKNIKFTGTGAIHQNTANNSNGVFGQETGQSIEFYGDTANPCRNIIIEHLRFTGSFGNPINFKGGAPQTYAAPKHRDIYIHDVRFENFGEGAQIADAQNVYVTNCTGLTNSDYTFGDCFEFVRVKHGKIDGCYFRACCGGSGIDLFSAQETTVSNCTIINGSNGIDIQPDRFVVPAFTHSKNIIISNVTHDGQGESGQGINMSNNANTKLSNVFISDCYLTNSLVGIAIGPQADTMPGPVVINNTVVEKCQKGIVANYVKDVTIQGGRVKKCTSYGIAIERNYITNIGLYGKINVSGLCIDSNAVGIYCNIVSNVGLSGHIESNLYESNTLLIEWTEAVKNSPVSFRNLRNIVKTATPSTISNQSGVSLLKMTGTTAIAGFYGKFHNEELTITGTPSGSCIVAFLPSDPGGIILSNRATFAPDSLTYIKIRYDKWADKWIELGRGKNYVGSLSSGAIGFLNTETNVKYDAANFFWNDNKKLGIGTNTPTSLPGWAGAAIHIFDAAGLPSVHLSSAANADMGIALEGGTRGNLFSNNGLDLTFSRSGSSSPLRIRSNYTGSTVTIFSLDPGTNIPQWLNTSAYKLPSGTDAQRPAGQIGFIRHNITTGQFEMVRSGTTYENIVSTPVSDTHATGDALIYNGSAWASQGQTSNLYSADFTISGYETCVQVDATAAAVNITAGGSMVEGLIYTIRCRGNGTNNIVINSASGFALPIDGDLTVSPTTYTCSAGEVITLRRLPGASVIIVDK